MNDFKLMRILDKTVCNLKKPYFNPAQKIILTAQLNYHKLKKTTTTSRNNKEYKLPG